MHADSEQAACHSDTADDAEAEALQATAQEPAGDDRGAALQADV
jgi:hypothetical protein